MTVTDFITLLASKAPAPGGGSAAALTAATGIGLTHMVTQLTLGKKKYAEHEALIKEIAEQAATIKTALTECIDKDTAAFNEITTALTLPKETDDEKTVRSLAMQAALKNAATVPMEVMALCLEALKLTEKALGKSNANAASDLGVAALNLSAGLKGAWLNVLINISGIEDEKFAGDCKQKGEGIVTEAEKIANVIYTGIVSLY